MSDLNEALDLLKKTTNIEFLVPRMGKLQCRRLLGAKLQDTAIEPLDPLVLERIPFSCRGRWAVTGYDPDRAEDRTFFAEFMKKLEAVAESFENLHVYLLGSDSDPEFVYLASSPQEAAAFVKQWCKEHHGLTVAVAPSSSDHLGQGA